ELDAKEDHDDIAADYIVDEKARSTTMTASGIAKAEKFFEIENFSDPENAEISHHIYQAMRAYGIMKRDIDYVVKDDEVLIVDSFTGRIMPGRRFSDGLHQAIEAKERVEIQKENRTVATITFQNYFRMYNKLSGMTGTALSEENEFREIYNLDVVEVPTNKPMIRTDHSDVVYKSKKGKDNAIIEQIKKCHEKGQPVLVGTVSIEKSEELSHKLKMNGIKHTVLNAKFHEREADIVAQAGKLGAVTISTNMAGRGTDILLGGNAEYLAKAEMRNRGYEEDVIALATGSSQSISEEAMAAREVYRELYKKFQEQIKPEAEKVCAAGGLFVIGTERHESRRIDNQLRGRSGRQGDPGESRFYLSLEDDLMRLFNTQLVARVMAKGMPEGEPIESKSVSKGVRNAQKAVESRNFEIRKNVLKYDDVMNKQRTVIYAERQAVLKGEDIHEDIEMFISDTVASYVHGANRGSDKPKDWDWAGMVGAIKELFPTTVTEDDARKAAEGLKGDKAAEAVKKLFVDDALNQYDQFEDRLGEEGLRTLERRVVLAVLDRKWREHLYEMDYLKDGIGLRGMGQRDPLVEYQREGYQMYNSMIEAIKEESVQLLFHIDLDSVAQTEDHEDIQQDVRDDQAVDQAEVAMGDDVEEQDEVESDETQLHEPEEPDQRDDHADEVLTAANEESIKEAYDDDEAIPESGLMGPAPMSHAEGKVPASKRPKNEELKTPWADGRTFPGTSKNAPCPCGSGRKYKMCHGQNEQ
ncbi:SEC-C metal-binding domain-containing protein, partial [Bifidobacterium sp.]|uniref:preprotein translocase subunit SecA n=1 Tax=Bifidobacterium sp. TaxID=41200 RepID=UPI003865CE54